MATKKHKEMKNTDDTDYIDIHGLKKICVNLSTQYNPCSKKHNEPLSLVA